MESCFGWRVGDAEDMAAAVISGCGCAWGETSEDADMIRGMSGVRSSVLQSIYFKGVSVLFLGSVSLTALSPTLLTSSGRSWFWYSTFSKPLSPSPFLIYKVAVKTLI